MCFTVGKRSKKGKRTNEDDRRLLPKENKRNDNAKLKQANELPFFPITSIP